MAAAADNRVPWDIFRGRKDGERESPGTWFGTHLRPMGLNVLGYQSHLDIVAILFVPRNILSCLKLYRTFHIICENTTTKIVESTVSFFGFATITTLNLRYHKRHSIGLVLVRVPKPHPRNLVY